MPVRKIPKSYCNVTGIVASEKSDKPIGYESRPERYFIKQVSFNPNVKSCEEQPVRVPYKLQNGRPSHYTPDFLIHFVDHLSNSKYWKPLLVEVKPRRNLTKHWEKLRPKFLAARKYAFSNGWEFTIISDKEIVTQYLKNVVFLTRYKTYPVNGTHKELILESLKQCENPTPKAVLQNITSNEDRIKELIPTLWKLVAEFTIDVDLEVALNMISPLRRKSDITENNYEQLSSVWSGRISHARWRALRYYPSY